MVGPDSRVELLHLLAGGQGDVSAAGHHPRHNAHAAGEHHGALGRALPQGAGEIAVGQGQDEGHRDDVGGVGVVDHAVLAVRGLGADAVVHVVAGELAGGLAAVHQAPADAVGIALVIDLDHADGILGIGNDVAEELAAAGGEEVGAGQILAGDAHGDPGTGLSVEEGGDFGDFRVGETVGQVAAVAFVPALMPAVVSHADVFLDDRDVEHAHCLIPPVSIKVVSEGEPHPSSDFVRIHLPQGGRLEWSANFAFPSGEGGRASARSDEVTRA